MTPAASMQFTPAQRAAIAAAGNVLVVAGAGTGKTRTLVERCLRLVREGVSLENLLLVTFTEAAAAEMRHRLRLSLEAESAEHPGELHLREQLALLDGAHICTLHSFCLDLIREHFHELGLDPQIIVLDERQTQPLIEQSLQSVLDPLFTSAGGEAGAVREWMERSSGDAAGQLRALVLKLHRYAQSLPDPELWLAEQIRHFSAPDPAAWRAAFLPEFAAWLEPWAPRISPLAGCAFLPASGVSRVTSALGGVASLPEAVEVLEILAGWRAALKGKSGAAGKVRNSLKALLEESAVLLALVQGGDGTDRLQEDWGLVRPLMIGLLRLVQQFGSAFARAKRELGGVDFADLEQLSLRLLWRSEDGRAVPSAAALQCRALFEHVFVDEVQDINSAQDAILRAVSRPDGLGNRFLVGDVKQSIYRFRLANPAIFRGYEEQWRRPGCGGGVIDLNENFRSRAGVLTVINSIFGSLMRPALGGVSYDDSARLRFGNPEARHRLKDGGQPCLELRVFTGASASEEPPEESSEAVRDAEDLDAAGREARWIARRLLAMHRSGHRVWDDSLKEFRAVRWSDMVVLLRSPGVKSEVFAREFHAAGVPLSAPRGGFFEAQEILDLLSLLRLLDNPLQDIPLLAVLRSPLFGFSLEDLARIRGGDRRIALWTALQSVCRRKDPADGDLPSRLERFLARHHAWREQIQLGSLTACLESVLADTRLEALLESSERGPERLANVQRLLELARQFDPYQRQGLFRFLCFVDAQIEQEQDIDAAAPPGADTVRILSIHRSKGLEFPVVVIADLGKPFNMGDTREEIVLDEQFGLCPRGWIPGTRSRYPTLARWLAARRGERELRGEEMRLLYVALTRARDHLVLVGSGPAKYWIPQPADDGGEASVAAVEPERAQSALAWLASWFHATAQPAEWTDGNGGANAQLSWNLAPWSERELEPGPESGAGAPATPASAGDAAMLPVLLERMRWRYPYESATREPVKTTVSVLRRRGMEDPDASTLLPRRRPSGGRTPAPRSGLSSAERGTAHHVFLQWLDLARAETALDLRNEAERLRTAGILADEQSAALDFNALLGLWQSDAGRRIRGARDHVQRELPFTARLSAAELRGLGVIPADSGLGDEEFVVVQGQVDLAVVLPAEIWLFDLKTDAVAVEEVAAHAADYRVQLQIYSLALERVYRRPVTARWLHFLAAGVTVDVPAPRP